jgi:hypothetical protein
MSKDEALLDAEEKAASKIDKWSPTRKESELLSRLIQEELERMENNNDNDQPM